MRATRDKHSAVLLPWLGSFSADPVWGPPSGPDFPCAPSQTAAHGKSLLSSLSHVLVSSCPAGPLCTQSGLASPALWSEGGSHSSVCSVCPLGPDLGWGDGTWPEGLLPRAAGGLPPYATPAHTRHTDTPHHSYHTHTHTLTTCPVSQTPHHLHHTHIPHCSHHMSHTCTHTPPHTLQHILPQTPHHSHHTHTHTHPTPYIPQTHIPSHMRTHPALIPHTHTLPHILSHTRQLSHHVTHLTHTHTPPHTLTHTCTATHTPSQTHIPSYAHTPHCSYHTHTPHPPHTQHTYTPRHTIHSRVNSLQPCVARWIWWLSFQFTHPREWAAKKKKKKKNLAVFLLNKACCLFFLRIRKCYSSEDNWKVGEFTGSLTTL